MNTGLAGGDWMTPGAVTFERVGTTAQVVVSAALLVGGIALTIASGWISGSVLALSAFGLVGLGTGVRRAAFRRFALRSDGFSIWVRADNGSVRQVSAGDVGGVARRYFHRADRAGGVIHSFLIVHRSDRRCIFKLREERWKHSDLEELCRVLGRREVWPGDTTPVTPAQLVREFPGSLSLGERHPMGVLVAYLAGATAVVALLIVILAG